MLEAMAVGVPVLGSDTAPVREAIRDGENGFLTPFFDAALLADRALDLVARRHEVARIGLEGRAAVLRRYDFETVALPVYLDLLKPLPVPVAELEEEGT
jgi:glycosyltransferase involved in cell wall biosynthesis